jgi:enamine deaminase RidA (YjgF/YER057c/UK114 family)
MPNPIIHSNPAPQTIGTCSQGARFGNTVYLARQICIDRSPATRR